MATLKWPPPMGTFTSGCAPERSRGVWHLWSLQHWELVGRLRKVHTASEPHLALLVFIAAPCFCHEQHKAPASKGTAGKATMAASPHGIPLTSVRHHPHVGFDHLQVDAVLLLPNDDGPPEPPVGCAPILCPAVPKQIRAVPRHVLGRGHRSVIWQRDKPCTLPQAEVGLQPVSSESSVSSSERCQKR